MAIIRGALKVLITGIDQDEQYRLLLARNMETNNTVNINKANLEEIVSELSNVLGADLVVEATGVGSSINQVFEIVRKLGKITVVGIPGQNKSNIK